jgi:2-dehydropantoate 2-reductase
MTAAGASPNPAPTRTLVVGAGAVGSFLGALLGCAGHDVTLVRIFEPDSSRPIELIRPGGTRTTIPVLRVTRTETAPPPDLIVVAVKMPALREALVPTLRWPSVPTLTVENGIGAEQIAAEVRSLAPILSGSLTAPIRLVSEDVVEWMGKGGLGLAAFTSNAAPLLPVLVADFRRAGLRAAQLADARSMKWSKLLANLLANATGAILDMDADEIYRDRQLFCIERGQLLEATAVMASLGLRPVAIPGAAVPWLVRGFGLPAALGRPILTRAVGGARAGKIPSLRIHVRSAPPDGPVSEPTEVAWMNGAISRAGAELGVPTPINSQLTQLVQEVASDPERRTWLRGHPERFLAELANPGETAVRAPGGRDGGATGDAPDSPADGVPQRS